MRLLSRFSLMLLGAGLFALPQSGSAQRPDRDDSRRAKEAMEARQHRNDGWRDGWADDDDRGARRRAARAGRRDRDDISLMRRRAALERWCRRHPNERRCNDDLILRRGNSPNWCWDRNRDGRCDRVNTRRRDRRDVWGRDDRWPLRDNDRWPDWRRWLGSEAGQMSAWLIPGGLVR